MTAAAAAAAAEHCVCAKAKARALGYDQMDIRCFSRIATQLFIARLSGRLINVMRGESDTAPRTFFPRHWIDKEYLISQYRY